MLPSINIINKKHRSSIRS